MTADLLPIRFHKSILLITAGLAILISMLISTTRAAPQGTQVLIQPTLLNLASAETITATIRVEDVHNLFGLELDLLYDPSIIHIDTFQPGPFLSADFVVEQKIDNHTGHASLAYTQIGQNPRSGSGDIVLITLRRTDCPGQSPLQLMDVILSDENGKAIPYTLESNQADSGAPLNNRKATGFIFHDIDQNGTQGPGESRLTSWPVYLQRLRVGLFGSPAMALSDPGGFFEISSLSCGQYQLWSQNGSSLVLTQTISIPFSADLEVPALPITGTLRYPLQQLFLPVLTSQPQE